MVDKIILADAGGTKSSWAFIRKNQVIVKECEGLNPNYLDDNTMYNRLPEWPFSDAAPIAVYFFGAGLGNEVQNQRVKSLLKRKYNSNTIRVENDLMAACLATAGANAGIVCILGTGANACVYDGKRITQSLPSPGFILGDEGAGSWLGKQLLKDFIDNNLPEVISRHMQQAGITYEQIIENVYRGPAPGKWIASQTHFLGKFRTNTYTQNLLEKGFSAFETAFLKKLPNKPPLPVHAIGGIAANFSEEWHTFLEKNNYIIGSTHHKPLSSILNNLHVLNE